MKTQARKGYEMQQKRHAPGNPGHEYLLSTRRRAVRKALESSQLLPLSGLRILDVGCGLADSMADFSVPGLQLFGVDINPLRLGRAKGRLPLASVAQADAGHLPFASGKIDLVLLFTVLSSILDPQLRRQVAAECERVLAPKGVILGYDMALSSPNPATLPIRERDWHALFPNRSLHLDRVSLAPPLARAIAPHSPMLARCLESIPWLRTHRLVTIGPN